GRLLKRHLPDPHAVTARPRTLNLEVIVQRREFDVPRRDPLPERKRLPRRCRMKRRVRRIERNRLPESLLSIRRRRKSQTEIAYAIRVGVRIPPQTDGREQHV